MPALSGMLHCAAGLLAVRRKAFAQGEGMNRPIAVMCLRPFVGFLSAVVAAILLYASNHADAQTQAPPMIGIMYLGYGDVLGAPPHNWSTDPALTNPYAQGISLRTQWNRVEPHEHANANDFYWDYLDQGVALAAAHGKKVSISVQAGVETPQWVYDAGAPAFYVTEQYGYSAITDGVTTAGSTTVISAGDTAGWIFPNSIGLPISGGSIPAEATIVTVNSSSNVTISAPATQSATGVAITTAHIEPMPLPWDPVFQQKWGAFIQALAARYANNPNVAYVVMGGPGRHQEAYFCFTPYDMDYFINTLGGLPNWEAGVKWIIDQYGTYFPNTPFLMATAAPIPLPSGDDSIRAVVNYGIAQYPGNHFGIMSCGLQYPDGPANGSVGATYVPLMCPTSTVGYQFFIGQRQYPGGPASIDPVTGRFMLDLGLERGFNFGAHFIEVYPTDMDDPVLAAVLTAWGALLTTTPPIAIPPTGLTATATSSSTINLGWIDNAINEIGQRIERSVGSNANYSFLTNVGANITAFTDTGLVDGTQYYYRVRAFNTGGSSTYSNEQSAVTTLNSPTCLTATTVSSSQISLTWCDTSSSETGYKIEQSPVDNLHYTEIATVGPNATSYNATTLNEGTKYYYRVRAYNAITTSGYTAEKNATTFWNIPVAPSELRITSRSSNSITLAWTDNSGNESGFKIQRKQGATGMYTQIGTPGANVTTYTDNDSALLDGTQYYYKVCAYNPAGDSAYSNEVNGITLLKSPTSLTATAVSSSEIDLTWNDNSLTEDGYRIEQSPVDNLHYTEIATVGPNVTSYSATGLSEGTKYYYRVRAYNAIATSGYSNEKNATTFSNIPAAPSGLRITTLQSNKIILTWTDNSGNETGFKIQRKGATGGYTDLTTTGANATQYSDTTVTDGTLYYYRVCATNTAGDSAYSNEVSGITPLLIPTSLSATAISSSQINLTWTDNSSSESGYKIEQSPVDNLHYTEVGIVGPNVTAYNATGLNGGTRYYYRVRAYNANTISGYSSEKNATTLSNIPVAPSGLTITTLQSAKIVITWTDNSNNETGFKIQRKGATGGYTDLTTTGANATQYSDTTVTDGTLYYYRVCATNTAGDSAYSNEVSGITPLLIPTSLSATAISSSQINLTWTDNSSSESGYKIEQSPVDNLHYTEVGIVGPNVTAYNATGLNEGTKYYYRVRAYNANTISGYSSEQNATTLSNTPVAPSGLRITTLQSNRIIIAWTDNSNNETGFKIQRKGATGAYADLTTTGANATQYSDSSVTDGTLYYYRVRATNTAGDSAYSNEVSGITPLLIPTSLSATAISSSQINLTWTDNSSSESGYKIEQSPVDNLHYTEVGIVGPNVTAYNATGLNGGTRYYYRVRAYNANTISGYSSEKNATTLSNIPVAPSGLTITTLQSAKIVITWTDNSNNETGFKIQRKGATGGYTDLTTTGANATQYSDTTVTDGTSYYYRVCATNTAGDSAYSNEVNGITPLLIPTSLSATAISSSQIDLTWTDNSSSESGYRIEQSPVDNLHYTEIATVGPNVTAYSDIGLSGGTKYYYRVRGYNANTLSEYSSEKNATTLANTPVAPSDLTITTLQSAKIVITWTDNSGNETGFKIQRKGATGGYTDLTTTGANATQYSDTTVTDGTLYYYRVCATNTAGDSAYSNEVSGITPLLIPTSLSATAISSSQINLTWTDNSSSESGYKIEQSPVDNLHYTEVGIVGPNVTAYNATGLNGGTRYYYRVRAYNANTISGYSSEKNATTLSNIPVAPSGLTITTLQSAKIVITWTDNSNNETGFKIQRKGATGGYTDLTTTGANATHGQRHYRYRWHFVLLPGLCYQHRWRFCLFKRSQWHHSSGNTNLCYCNGDVVQSHRFYLD